MWVLCIFSEIIWNSWHIWNGRSIQTSALSLSFSLSISLSLAILNQTQVSERIRILMTCFPIRLLLLFVFDCTKIQYIKHMPSQCNATLKAQYSFVHTHTHTHPYTLIEMLSHTFPQQFQYFGRSTARIDQQHIELAHFKIVRLHKIDGIFMQCGPIFDTAYFQYWIDAVYCYCFHFWHQQPATVACAPNNVQNRLYTMHMHNRMITSTLRIHTNLPKSEI